MIQVITFDLWNTIFTNRFYSDLRLSYLFQFLDKKQISYSFSEVKNAFASAFHFSDIDLVEINYRHIYTSERISKLFQALNIKFFESDYKLIESKFEEAMLKDPPHLKIGVKETLKELSNDYNIGLISNTGITPGRVIKEVFRMYDIQKYFQLTLFSDEIGFYKPHPIMFKTALKQFNCKPQNAIHIGDILETDIKGAKECNMLAIWINDSFSLKSDKIQPDYEIQQISETIQIIKGIS